MSWTACKKSYALLRTYKPKHSWFKWNRVADFRKLAEMPTKAVVRSSWNYLLQYFLCQQALSIRNTYAWQLHLYKTSRKNRNYCFNSVVHVEQSANVDTANVRSLWKSIGFDSNFLLYKILWRLWLLMGNLCTHRFAHQHVTETWNFLNNYNVNS